jgi:hypothetical protein
MMDLFVISLSIYEYETAEFMGSKIIWTAVQITYN